MTRKRVAVLISGRGSNMEALIAAAQADDYPADIVLVVSNVPDAGGLKHAREAGIPTAVVDHTRFGKDRAAFERDLNELLEANGVEIVCLAGFMRLLTPWFVGRWQGRLINIHPALLPAFKGVNTHERALAAGVRTHGASVHFVVPEMDAGPVIAQAALNIEDGDTAQTLAARVIAIEHRIYPAALRLVAQGRVHVEDGRCVIDNASGAERELLPPLQ